jgi:competence ComEA-like helix-hairpin-helix protein
MSSRSWILALTLAAALAPPPAPAQNEPRPPLNLNCATVEQLDRLPGIGPLRAAAIVRIREHSGAFRSAEELRALPRLSEKLFARLHALVIVDSAPCQSDPEPDKLISEPGKPTSEPGSPASEPGKPAEPEGPAVSPSGSRHAVAAPDPAAAP